MIFYRCCRLCILVLPVFSASHGFVCRLKCSVSNRLPVVCILCWKGGYRLYICSSGTIPWCVPFFRVFIDEGSLLAIRCYRRLRCDAQSRAPWFKAHRRSNRPPGGDILGHVGKFVNHRGLHKVVNFVWLDILCS